MTHEKAMESGGESAGRMAELLARSTGAYAAAFGTIDVERQRVRDIWSARSGSDDGADAALSTKVAEDALLAFAGTKSFDSELLAQAPKGSGNLWSFGPKHVVSIGSLDTYPNLHFVVFLFEDAAERDNENIRNLARIGVNYVGTLSPRSGMPTIDADIPVAISEGVLKCLSFGYIVVDAKRRVHALKDSMDGWFATNTAFEIQNGQLFAHRQRDRQILFDSITAASDTRRKTSALLLDRGQSANKETVYVMPIDGSDGLVLLTFGQGTSDREIRDIALDAMGLTPAERRLTQSLVDGKTVQEAAAEANLTVSTARSYLKSIFQKTGIRSQSQLVTLCLNITPAVSHSNANRAIGEDDANSERVRRPISVR